MAQAIRKISKRVPDQQEEQAQAAAEIMRELTENKEAVLGMIQLMKGLQEMGIYDALRGMLENRTEVGAIAIQQINQPFMHNVIKNGMNGAKFLGSLSPEQTDKMMKGVGLGLQKMAEAGQQEEPQSLWKMRKKLKSPEIKASIAAVAAFMEGMGTAFVQPSHHEQNKKG
ncbi:DUF1641 domain-containing protein [Domibacillus sp. PGB-M46]|uniref:DUF1641 domain-containing protein n=1 Tax=Domibacillus sp. PGB-M46 TaxID=2910255 RepID=UPI001F587064|nr:DUF1641 domain-containing protein [Domibacillus sp. PGB-M46]MCI2256379.1 DUF1641 domain-containing protein [Domibacillus sp. PGB-M46]